MTRVPGNILKIDCKRKSTQIGGFIREQVCREYKKKGVVVGLSGGVDSSVVAALCVKGLGPDKVLGVILPDKESAAISAKYARMLAGRLGIKAKRRDITPILDTIGIYKIRESVVKSVISGFHPGDSFRIVMPGNILDSRQLNVPSLEVKSKYGRVLSELLSAENYLDMVAATNVKHRARMMLLYHYAEQNNYLVAGTTNMTEYLLGFFVKYGDGGVDIDPIRHLYKTEVYQLARYLRVPEVIIKRRPSPDTFSYPVSDEEFYFRLPYKELDLLLYAWRHNIPFHKTAKSLNISIEQIKRAFRDFQSKYDAGEYIRSYPPDPK